MYEYSATSVHNNNSTLRHTVLNKRKNKEETTEATRVVFYASMFTFAYTIASRLVISIGVWCYNFIKLKVINECCREMKRKEKKKEEKWNET